MFGCMESISISSCSALCVSPLNTGLMFDRCAFENTIDEAKKATHRYSELLRAAERMTVPRDIGPVSAVHANATSADVLVPAVEAPIVLATYSLAH